MLEPRLDVEVAKVGKGENYGYAISSIPGDGGWTISCSAVAGITCDRNVTG